MEQIPLYIPVIFGLTTLLTVSLFYKAAKNSKTVLIVLSAWLIFQAAVSLTGFYTINKTIPPRIALLGFPSLVFIIGLFVTKNGRRFLDKLDIKTLQLLHTVRIAVELVLFGLFLHKAVPQLMTFEGRNYDILSGLTAPFIYYLGFVKKKMSSKTLLLWNFICLGLLINIVVRAVLSAPTPLQQLAFDQPNIAILYFPYVWLPCCVVPLVLLAHLVSIRQLVNRKNIQSIDF